MFSFFQKILGIKKPWDGRDRRVNLRGNCALQVRVTRGKESFTATVLDVNPRAVRLRMPSAAKVRSGNTVQLTCHGNVLNFALDTVQGQVCWVKRTDSGVFAAVNFRDSLDNLLNSWVKPLLRASLSQVNQKRIHVRANCLLPCELVWSEGGVEKKMAGTLLDLSARGGLVETRMPMQVPTFDLHMVWGDGTSQKIRCQVRREQILMGGHFHYGLSFQMDDEQRRRLVSVVQGLLESPVR